LASPINSKNKQNKNRAVNLSFPVIIFINGPEIFLPSSTSVVVTKRVPRNRFILVNRETSLPLPAVLYRHRANAFTLIKDNMKNRPPVGSQRDGKYF
jgi:hypothetical protein